MSSIGIMVVDDHAVLRTGIRSMLEDEDGVKVVGEAEDGEQALELVDSIGPDVVLLDVKMPNMDGLTALRELQEFSPGLPVLIFSMYDDPAYVEQAIASGAAGYLLKTVGKDELVRAVKAAHEGQGYLQAEITRPVLSRFTRTYDSLTSDVHLSQRETQVLQLIADGLSNKQIAAELGIAEATVKTYVTSLFEKLGAVHRAHAVALALRHHLIG